MAETTVTFDPTQPLTGEQFKAALETFGKSVLEGVIEKLGLDNVDLKHKIHPFEDEKALLEKSPEMRLHSLLCGIKRQDLDMVTKAIGGMNETTSADGGFFVPDEIDNEILRVMTEFGTARQEMFVFPMGKAKKIIMPTLEQSVSVGWVVEGGMKPTSKAQFGTISLETKQMAGITVLTNQLLEDANIQIGKFIINLFGEALGMEEDKQFWGGDGTVFTGVFNANGPTVYTLPATKTKVTDLTYEDLIKVKNSVPVYYLRNAKWYFHRSVLTVIETLKDGNGQYIFKPDLKTLLGYPVVVLEDAPSFDGTADAGKTFMLFGNMKRAYIGNKSGTQVRLTDVGNVTVGETDINLFQTNQSAIRVEKRVAFSAGFNKTWVKIKTAAA